jgi:hypothetical protein
MISSVAVETAVPQEAIMTDSIQTPVTSEPVLHTATHTEASPLADLKTLIVDGLAAKFLEATPHVRAAFQSQINSSANTAAGRCAQP